MAKDKPKEQFFKRYWLFLAALGGLVGVLCLIVIRSSFWVAPSPSVSSPLDPQPIPPQISSPPSPSEDDLIDSPSPSPQAASPSPTAPPAFSPNAIPQGQLRVSNQTNHPVRVALLPQTVDQPVSPTPAAENSDSSPPEIEYAEPVHWDFAPEEGSTKGLLLSLPEGNLQLQGGDVLMAFAQDGSRRYWGPYVVGKTAVPFWNAESQEWELMLQP